MRSSCEDTSPSLSPFLPFPTTLIAPRQFSFYYLSLRRTGGPNSVTRGFLCRSRPHCRRPTCASASPPPRHRQSSTRLFGVTPSLLHHPSNGVVSTLPGNQVTHTNNNNTTTSPSAATITTPHHLHSDAFVTTTPSLGRFLSTCALPRGPKKNAIHGRDDTHTRSCPGVPISLRWGTRLKVLRDSHEPSQRGEHAHR